MKGTTTTREPNYVLAGLRLGTPTFTAAYNSKATSSSKTAGSRSGDPAETDAAPVFLGIVR